MNIFIDFEYKTFGKIQDISQNVLSPEISYGIMVGLIFFVLIGNLYVTPFLVCKIQKKFKEIEKKRKKQTIKDLMLQKEIEEEIENKIKEKLLENIRKKAS